jgi:hypothetical protein
MAVQSAFVGSAGADVNTTYFTTTGCQPYLVPAGETSLEIDAIGQAGSPGGNNIEYGTNASDVIPGGQGGEGAEVIGDVSVTPGSYVSASVSGIAGGYGGFGSTFTGEPPVNPGVGGDGGAASAVYQGQSCNGTPLVVAAGGGGGGGAGTNAGQYTWDYTGAATGGAGGTAGGPVASPGGSGGTGSLNNGGAGFSTSRPGVGGFDFVSFPLQLARCDAGFAGNPGSTPPGVGYGGDGGSASEGDPGPKDGCMAYISADNNSGGGGGGGGGLAGGAGGGGADDYAAAGGGGAAGTSYVAGARANPSPTAQAPSIAITPLPTAPSISVSSSATCIVDQYCQIPVSTLGYPLPPGITSGSLPPGLEITPTVDGQGYIEGTASGSGVVGDSSSYPITLSSSNGVSPDASASLNLTISWGPLSSLYMNPSGTQNIIAGQNYSDLSVFGVYDSGAQQNLSSVANWQSTKPEVATVSGGVVTPLTAGSTTVSASWDGQSVSDLISVTLGAPTSITVTPASPTVGLGETQQFSATAHYMNGSTADVTSQVVWSSSNPAAATIDSTGLATATGTTEGAQAGIYATLLYGDGTPEASGNTTLSVSLDNPTSITVTPAGPTVAAGSDTQFTATGGYPGGATADITDLVNWSTSDESISFFDAAAPGVLGVSPGIGVNSFNVTATAPADAVSGSTSVSTFAGDPVSITVTPNTPTLGLGKSQQFTATATYADNSTADVTSQVQWSSDPGISMSTVTPGLATATSNVEQSGVYALFTGPDGGQVSGNTPVTLSLDNPSSVTVTPANPTIATRGEQAFTATGTYPGGLQADITNIVAWTSSNTAYGTFSNNEFFATSLGNGTTTVSATAPGGAVGTTLVTIPQGDPTSLTVTRANATIGLGTSEQFTATVTYSDGSTADVSSSPYVQWSSYDNSLASVSADGMVTAKSGTPGVTDSITATFTSPDSTTVSGNATIASSISNPLSITVTALTSTTMMPGTYQFVTATGNYPGGYTAQLTNSATWASSDPSILSASTGSVEVPLVEPGGNPSVTASFGGVTGSLQLEVIGSVAINGPASDSTNYLSSYTSPAFTATGGSGSYTWQLLGAPSGLGLSATTGSSVSVVGVPNVTASTPFNMTIVATDENSSTDSSQVYFSLTIGLGAQAVSFTTAPTATAVTSQTLVASGGASGNPVVFSVDASSTPGSCAVSGTNGETLTFLQAGTCVVDAIQAGNYYYAEGETTVSIAVSAGISQTISFSGPGAALPNSSSYELVATGGGSGNPVTFSTTSSSYICTISGSTLYLNTGTGNCVIDADQAGANGYMPAPTVQVTVFSGLAQSLYWYTSIATPPSSVTVGATASVPGYYSGPYVVQALDSGGGSTVPIVESVDPATTNAACSVTPAPSEGIGAAYVSFDHAGTCVIDANQASDFSAFAPAPQMQTTITVGQGTQSVSFGSSPPSSPTVGGSYTPSVSVTTSGSAPAGGTYLATEPGVTSCTLQGNTLEFVHVGTCAFQALEQSNSDYTASSVITQSFDIGPGAQSVSIAPFATTQYAGSYQRLSATGGASGNPVQFSIDAATTNNACTLGDSGSVLFFGYAGTCVLDATQAGNSDYLAGQASVTVTVDSLSLAITSAPFTSPASTDPASPFTVQVDENGSPVVLSQPTTVDLYSSTATGVFAATPGGSPVTSVVIPADASSVTAYYGDRTAGSVSIIAVDPTGTYGPVGQVETIGTLAASSLSFAEPPPAEVGVGATLPVVGVLVSDSYGNPISGVSVTLSDTEGALAGTLTETTGLNGVATFNDLVVSELGTDSLIASSTGLTSITSSLAVVRAATVTGVSPVSGLDTGGTTVTISGSGFDGATSVSFGATPATSFSVVSDSEITAVSPAETAGQQVDVTVANVTGASPTSTADVFSFTGTTPQNVTFDPPPSGAVGTALDLSSVGSTNSGLPITYSVDQALSSPGDACSVAGSVLSFLATGTCDVVAEQVGSATYAPAEATASITTTPAATVTTVTANHAIAVVGQPVTFTAAVTDPGPSPVGTVTFSEGASVLCAAKTLTSTAPYTASCEAVFPAPGKKTVAASYSGDAESLQSSASSPAVLTVNKAQSTVALSVSPAGTTLPGVPLTLTAKVGAKAPGLATATGSVIFKDSASGLLCKAVLVAEQAHCTAVIPVQAHQWITAVYSGNSDLLASNRAVVHTVAQGYVIVSSTGHVIARGAAHAYGSLPARQLAVGIALTPDTKGYWIAEAGGAVAHFGDAPAYSPVGAKKLVAIAADPRGEGYIVVTASGQAFCRGAMVCHGGLSRATGSPVAALAVTPDGGGYYLLQADGVVTGFGDALVRGRLTASAKDPAVGIAAVSSSGYLVATRNGTVRAFGAARWFGSIKTTMLAAIAETADGHGYFLVFGNGEVFGRGDAAPGLSPGIGAAVVGFASI